jgi:hypothetical protein
MRSMSGTGISGPVFLHQAADTGLAPAWAEVAADVDGGQVLGDFAEQDDGAVEGHRLGQAHLSRLIRPPVCDDVPANEIAAGGQSRALKSSLVNSEINHKRGKLQSEPRLNFSYRDASAFPPPNNSAGR